MIGFKRQCSALGFLCSLFLIVYISSNWIAGHRAHVGSYYFAWERHIPFVPMAIIPYLSIDLFFIAAPFLTTSEQELRVFTMRIALAICLAGGCFLLFPLKFGFGRSAVPGFIGSVFELFRRADLPYNQFPSLHIALLALLFKSYADHSTGLLRVSIALWFALVGLSTLLCFQHHFVDILGGFALAALCNFAIPDETTHTFIPAPRIAAYYGLGSTVLFGLSFTIRPWTYLLLFPAISLATTAGAYVVAGPGLFRKQGGVLPVITWLFLWPILLGQRVSLLHYSQHCRAYDVLTGHLWIGRHLSNAEARHACENGVVAVIDLTCELQEPKPFRDIAYCPLYTLDLTAPLPAAIDRAIEFISRYAPVGIVYLHCKVGYSRTAVIAGAYLISTGQADTVEKAVEMIRRVRPSLIARPEAIRALEMHCASKKHLLLISENS